MQTFDNQFFPSHRPPATVLQLAASPNSDVMDTSYGNDVCPSFSRWHAADSDEVRVVLWTEAEDPDQRDTPGGERFAVTFHGEDDDGTGSLLLLTNNLQEALATFTGFVFPT